MSRRKQNPATIDEIIVRDPDIMSGAPVFPGTRVFIRDLFDFLAAGYSIDEFCASSPRVSRETAAELLHRISAQIEDGTINA